MRLLYIVHQFLPRHVTGTEQYVHSLALGMRDRGHEVSILTLEPFVNLDSPGRMWIERDEEVDGIPVRRVGLHLDTQPNLDLADYQNPLAVRFLRRYLDENEFDLAHVFHLRFLGVGALNELRVVGVPSVVNLMDFWFLCPRYTLLRGDGELCQGPPEDGLGCVTCLHPAMGKRIEASGLGDALREIGVAAPRPPDMTSTDMRWSRALIGRKDTLFAALAMADAIVAPSQFLCSMFERNGFTKGVIRHVPYGVDPGRLGGRRKEWSLDGKHRLEIGYVGSVTEHKGLHVLIPAARAIADDRWHLHIHGSMETHPEYSKRVRQLAEDDARITYHGSFKPADLGGVLERLDLLVVPSLWYENTPFSILEAQMVHLPVLASDVGGITESIEHGRSGYLFQVGSIQALTEALRDIVAAPEQLAEMKFGGGALTLDDNLDDFEKLYAEIAG